MNGCLVWCCGRCHVALQTWEGVVVVTQVPLTPSSLSPPLLGAVPYRDLREFSLLGEEAWALDSGLPAGGSQSYPPAPAHACLLFF